MVKLTFTYKDNPYKEGTPEYSIWHSAFVHGLNSATKDMMPLLVHLTEQLELAVKHTPKELK